MSKLLISFLLFSLPLFNFDPGEIHLHIRETDNDQGNVLVLVFNQSTGFPSDPDKALMKLSLPLKGKKATITLPDIEPGKYAISVFHDEDGDGKMDKNSVGYPLDKYGFSNNPSSFFGPPSFEKAAFEVGTKPVRVDIKLR